MPGTSSNNGTLIILTIATHLTSFSLAQSSLADCHLAAAAFHSTCEGTVAPPLVRDIPPVQTFSLNAPNSLLTGAELQNWFIHLSNNIQSS